MELASRLEIAEAEIRIMEEAMAILSVDTKALEEKNGKL